MKDNLTIEYPPDFLAGWDGCSHLDCLPQCRLGLESGYCERIERAFSDYQGAMERADNGRNTDGKSYYRPNGGRNGPL
jgi:hypothetical protein